MSDKIFAELSIQAHYIARKIDRGKYYYCNGDLWK